MVVNGKSGYKGVIKGDFLYNFGNNIPKKFKLFIFVFIVALVIPIIMPTTNKNVKAYTNNDIVFYGNDISKWQGEVDFTKMQGSWAGAMGHFQFMPSTFNAYAVDFNEDGKIDIWSDFEDAAGSAANYLTTIGWNKQIPWGMQVKLPWNFDYSLTGRNKNLSVEFWNKAGVRTIGGKKISLAKDLKVSIITPEGKNGRAYLITDNFYKIMHWNRSENYALAIGVFADYIKSGKKWQKIPDLGSEKIKISDVLKIQSFINKMGWSKLDEDGQLGTNTKKAIQQVQKKAKLTQDGYPDYQLLRKINNYNKNVGFAVPVPTRKLHKQK